MASSTRWTEAPDAVRPMLATPHDRPTADSLVQERSIYELKYDGMRVLAWVEPGEPLARVTLRSRNGLDKTAQFPDVTRELRRFGKGLRAPVLLDGELVALTPEGEPTSFQALAGRIHLATERDIQREAGRQPVAFVAFDILRDGAEDLRGLPLVDRKARLERVFGTAGSERVRMSEMAAGDGRRLYERVVALEGEGLVAKDAHSKYESGRRSPAWRKLKVHRSEPFVVCGWTEPRSTRAHFGSLLLGYYASASGRPRSEARGSAVNARGTREEPPGVLVFAGMAGSGFSSAELERVWTLLQARRTDDCPFATPPQTPERAHWVRPELVAEVRYAEWTREGYLRHPVYLGLRDDKAPGEVVRDRPSPTASDAETEPQPPTAPATLAPGGPRAREAAARVRRASPPRGGASRDVPTLDDPRLVAVADRLEELEANRKDGAIALPDGATLEVSNLGKLFWPTGRITKGELLRYYVRISPWLLPAVADRPLVMKRYPNGVTGKSFYQQRAPDEVPTSVRVEIVEDDGEPMPRMIGGTLVTLIYMTQLAAISQDPWFSRVQSRHEADYVALDLDPMPGVPFTQVLEVARAIRDEVERLDVTAVAKTSGSSGLHVYFPLAPGTPYDAGQLFCQIVATLVAERLPRIATVERAVAKRGRTVYVDYLQNIEGKTIATVYSARASEFAGVSTPLAWAELDDPIHPEDFTLRTVLPRFVQVGDLWAPLHGPARIDLRDALARLARR